MINAVHFGIFKIGLPCVAYILSTDKNSEKIIPFTSLRRPQQTCYTHEYYCLLEYSALYSSKIYGRFRDAYWLNYQGVEQAVPRLTDHPDDDREYVPLEHP
jgi:hypothetical protein